MHLVSVSAVKDTQRYKTSLNQKVFHNLVVE